MTNVVLSNSDVDLEIINTNTSCECCDGDGLKMNQLYFMRMSLITLSGSFVDFDVQHRNYEYN